jgi:hypothetical protein
MNKQQAMSRQAVMKKHSAVTKPSGLGKRKIVIGVVVILLIGGSVWAVMHNLPDPQVEKVKQMQAEAFKEGVTPEQRRQSFQLVRQEMEKLSPDQRHELWQQVGQERERQMDKRMDEYFALPPAKRVAEMDKMIKEMEQRRKEFEQRRSQAGQGNRGGQQGPMGGQRGPGGGGLQANVAGGGPQTNAGGPRPPMSSDQRMQRRDQRLDRSSAEQRAKRSVFMAEMQQRRIQLGLPPMPQRGPRGPR